MHIDVRDLLFEPVGTSRQYALTDETPTLEDVAIAQPVEGEVVLTRLEEGIMAIGSVQTAVELECHRCLRTFTQHLNVKLSQLYAEQPGEDQLPIKQHKIDLAPAVREELLLAIPIKAICGTDCPGPPGKTVAGPEPAQAKKG